MTVFPKSRLFPQPARHAQLTGVQKAPRHEVAGSWAPAGQRRYGDLMSATTLMVGATLPGSDRDVWTGEVGRLQWPSRQALGAHRNGEVAMLTVGLSHDVSTMLGIGHHLGSQPRAKASITIMRAPQRGHGQGSTRRAFGVISGCSCGSAGGTIWSSARAVAMFSARLALAKSP